ncbi:RAMP superfamily CRISPR-associated protein [Vibrio sp. MEBiC08052]|uniref:RAMP superfamily CRISPR-associated protein n=1 Tax=Vibrio sp. MEBiC08052 TaxID=1761910 RepID=UPI0007405B12|nr:RAMP superfamily CRISPR-associated protein [Vibrio sp. MEBiC08052]KUI97417.1 hypothetical protein VRK_36060 [Vibrio sp. MEBiC08052]
MNEFSQYRTIYRGTLKQISDMSIGGTEAISPVDMPLAKDGQGRYVIKGTTLAGALVYTLNKLNVRFPKEVAFDDEYHRHHDEPRELGPSAWKVSNSYLSSDHQNVKTQLRQYVKIDAASGAAEDGALFSMEVISRGVDWDFLMEVNTRIEPSRLISQQDETVPTPDELAQLALRHWLREGVFLGRRSVAGNGWFELSAVEKLTLTTEHIDCWPNNELTPQASFDRLKKMKSVQVCQLEPAENAHSNRIEIEFTLTAGPYRDDDGKEWGLDGFLIAGHAAEQPLDIDNSYLKKHIGFPEHYSYNVHHDEPDRFFVQDQNGQPFIPGSTLRGILHHEISRILISEDATLAQSKELQPKIEQLFGSTDVSSRLFVGDATLDKTEAAKTADWQGLILHNHAENEFTAGVYGSNKFVRMSIVNGTFRGKIILEAANSQTLQEQHDLLLQAIEKGKKRQLPVGGKQWVDSGWLEWDIEPAQDSAEEKAS